MNQDTLGQQRIQIEKHVDSHLKQGTLGPNDVEVLPLGDNDIPIPSCKFGASPDTEILDFMGPFKSSQLRV